MPMNSSDFMVIAHRGASSYAPENTLAAFDLALQMGIHQIELDVHCSPDGGLDPHVGQGYWEGDGAIFLRTQ
jgi:glycerophosphoryl diester phosphodiesterase